MCWSCRLIKDRVSCVWHLPLQSHAVNTDATQQMTTTQFIFIFKHIQNANGDVTYSTTVSNPSSVIWLDRWGQYNVVIEESKLMH